MKKILSICLLGVFTAFTASAQYQNTTIKVGQKAPELAYQNPDGKTISLQDINKGRYVLLDFWASWCGPCRLASPSVVKMYQEFKDKKFKDAPKGFTIVSVSLDRNKDAWIKAIKDDHLSWPYQMSDLKAWQSEAAEKYGVRFIPQAFLIGPDGKVIGAYNSPEAAKEALQKFEK